MKKKGCKLKHKTNLLRNRFCKSVQCLILGVVLSSLLFSMYQVEYIYINHSIPKASTLHSPISLNGNEALDTFCAGNGTDGLSWDTAHVIEDLEIDAGGTGSGIYIKNTTRFLIIRNCNIIDSGLQDYSPNYIDSGIFLTMVKNVKIIECDLSDNNVGIALFYSINNNISNNNASNNEFGIQVRDCINNSILGNIFSYIKWTALLMTNSSFNNISDNDASHNVRYGIYLHQYCDNNTVSDNDASYNQLGGIKLIYSSSNTLSGNNASYNDNFGISMGTNCHYNEVYNNILCYNDEDIIDLGENNDIHNNDNCSGIPSYPISWISVISLCSLAVSMYVVQKKFKK